MDPSDCTVRRANLEDLSSLKGLWDIARLPGTELEKHLTDFQVVTRPDGVLLGAIGLRMAAGHGLLHGEAFYSPEHDAPCRSLLWSRIQVLARNHGLARIWTRESAPFWREAGFKPAEAEQLKRLPPAFGDPHAAWTTMPLRDEILLNASLEREFELFQLAQRESSEKLLRQAKALKWAAGLIALGFFVAALALIFILFRRAGPGLPH